jgi:hypothetical protein
VRLGVSVGRSFAVLMMVHGTLAPSTPPYAAGADPPGKESQLNPVRFGLSTGYFGVGKKGRNVTLRAELGADLSRVGVWWREIERRRKHYNWHPLDRVVRLTVERGMEPFLVIVGSPKWACGVQPDYPQSVACPPKRIPPYKRFLRTLVTRYGDHVRYYEIWNEPNIEFFWAGGPDADQFARLLLASYAGIKRVDPNAQVVMGAPAATDLPWIDRVLASLGGRIAFDATAAHPYRFSAFPHTVGPWDPNQVLLVDGTPVDVTLKDELLLHQQVFYDAGYGWPDLWITEIGWPAYDDEPRPGLQSLSDQARFLEETYRLAMEDPDMSFIKGIMWFTDRDWSDDPNDPRAIEDFGFYGLTHKDRSWKPSAQVFFTLAQVARASHAVTVPDSRSLSVLFTRPATDGKAWLDDVSLAPTPEGFACETPQSKR